VKIDPKDIKIRKNWRGVKPFTRVEAPETDYNRAKAKQEWKDEWEELQDELDEESSGC